MRRAKPGPFPAGMRGRELLPLSRRRLAKASRRSAPWRRWLAGILGLSVMAWGCARPGEWVRNGLKVGPDASPLVHEGGLEP